MRTIIVAMGLFFVLGACRTQDDEQAKAEAERPQAVETLERPEIGYPQGPWWDYDTRTIALAAGHILVSHRDAKPMDRLISGPAKGRSREEAKQRAWKLYLELRGNPDRFAEVAARESDEPVSGALGGSLGSFIVETVPPSFVDGLGHVREGEVTRPVESEQGFHVLRRLKPSAPIQLDLAHIVIKYDGVGGWVRGDRPTPKRTREEARALAERIAREARQAPEQFARLVREHSDADDALRDGDMGSFSTYEMTDADARLFAAAERLPEGGVSEVIALEHSGFNVVRRSAPVSRPAFAATVLTIGYAESPLSVFRPNATRSRAEAEQLAQRLALELRRRPDQFDVLRGKHCDPPLCDGVVSWTKGRHLVAMEPVVERLAVGEVSAEPIDSPIGLLIVRREDAVKHPPAPPPTPMFKLPIGTFEQQPAQTANGS